MIYAKFYPANLVEAGREEDQKRGPGATRATSVALPPRTSLPGIGYVRISFGAAQG